MTDTKLNRLVLCLNASYEPLTTLTAKRALVLVMKGKAYVEEPTNIVIRNAIIPITIPSVIRLTDYKKIARQNKRVSRKGILLRDNYTCQYCHKSFESKKLTLDHVTPKSKGGANSWENLVSSCFPCNNKKSDKTLREAGMSLLRTPTKLSVHARHRALAKETDKAWDKYLFI